MSYLKAIVAFLLGALGGLSTGLMPDPSGATVLTWPEIISSVVTGLVAAGAVAKVKNAGTVQLAKLPSAAELAREAYEGYAQAVGNRSVNGDTLPSWEAMTAGVKDAWVRSQTAVLALLRR